MATYHIGEKSRAILVEALRKHEGDLREKATEGVDPDGLRPDPAWTAPLLAEADEVETLINTFLEE